MAPASTFRPLLRLLILSGPTREYIDPVRFLSNASSGRQGVALAREGLRRGHTVDLVQGPVSLTAPFGARVHPVVSAGEMLERARECHPSCDVLLAAAAVSDFRPLQPLPCKLKREGVVRWELDLVPTPDILLELAPLKAGRLHVGFALETDEGLRRAETKLGRKQLDWIVLNSPEAIGTEGGDYHLLGANGERRHLGRLTKEELARRLLDVIEREAARRGMGR